MNDFFKESYGKRSILKYENKGASGAKNKIRDIIGDLIVTEKFFKKFRAHSTILMFFENDSIDELIKFLNEVLIDD